jgi:hypothetical protein
MYYFYLLSTFLRLDVVFFGLDSSGPGKEIHIPKLLDVTHLYTYILSLFVPKTRSKFSILCLILLHKHIFFIFDSALVCYIFQGYRVSN